MRHIFLAAALVLLSHSPAALALEGGPDSECRWGMFGGPYKREPDLRLGRIVGDTRAFLLSDMDGCPLSPVQGRDCYKKKFLNPGSAVAVLPSNMPGLVCVLDPSRSGQPAGWLPQARVQVSSPDPNQPLASWAGEWRKDDDWVAITVRNDGKLSVIGRAFWPGKNVLPMHTGEFSGLARPQGNQITFSEQDPTPCQVKFELLSSNILAANDNVECGGANVSFGGVYARKR